MDDVITNEVTAGTTDPAGRIPLCLRIGVTGHRDLCAGDAALTDAIAEALTGIDSRRRAGTSATPVGLAIVSALAEGADRIVARLAMLRGASLEVVLPMPPGDYLTDFKSPSSRASLTRSWPRPRRSPSWPGRASGTRLTNGQAG